MLSEGDVRHERGLREVIATGPVEDSAALSNATSELAVETPGIEKLSSSHLANGKLFKSTFKFLLPTPTFSTQSNFSRPSNTPC